MTALDDRPDVDPTASASTASTPAGLAWLRLPDDAPEPTHEVVNQVPPLVGHDVSADVALRDGLEHEGGGWYADRLTALGRRAGEARWQEAGRLANEHEPVLRTHDVTGRRVDEVEFHPAWHELSEVAVTEGLAGALPWGEGGREPRPGSHVARAAGFVVWSQVEAGHGCPVSMTYAGVPALRATPSVAGRGRPAGDVRRSTTPVCARWPTSAARCWPWA